MAQEHVLEHEVVARASRGLEPSQPETEFDHVLSSANLRKTLAPEDFHVSDHSPWEDWEFTAWPDTTILRGRILVEGGRLTSARTHGELVLRNIDAMLLSRPAC